MHLHHADEAQKAETVNPLESTRLEDNLNSTVFDPPEFDPPASPVDFRCNFCKFNFMIKNHRILTFQRNCSYWQLSV